MRSRGASCPARRWGEPLTGEGRGSTVSRASLWSGWAARQTLDSPRTNGRLGLLGLRFPIFEMGPQKLPLAAVLRGGAVNRSPEAADRSRM